MTISLKLVFDPLLISFVRYRYNNIYFVAINGMKQIAYLLLVPYLK